VPPPVAVESIRVDERAYSAGASLDLPSIRKGLEIDYTAYSFVDPRAVRFKYKLEGWDEGWVDAGGTRQAIYPSLPPRNYRFRVLAANDAGVWNETGASLEFTIAPMVYQTLWFRLASIGAFVGLLWMLYRVRVRHIERTLNMRFEERLRERTRIARELHDTLLQNVSGFALQLDGLSKVVTAPAHARDYLRELRIEAESWLKEAREAVWDLRTPASGEADLAAAIQEIGNQLTDGASVRLTTRVRGTRRDVDERTRQNILKIAQEAVRNAVAHSGATAIGVELAYREDGKLQLRISDDGRGFDLDAASRMNGHMGLATMRERAESIGADFQIDTSAGCGVTIEVISPGAIPAEAPNDDRQPHTHPPGR
jgi:signal transduction histidine kinase